MTRRRASLADGFRVLGVAIRRQPRLFAIAAVGSVVFGTLQVADAWVLGWATQHALTPTSETGRVPWAPVLVAVALFAGVALLRAAGILARRVGGGVMQYRLMADDRRAVSRQYLDLPITWHQAHPTGQLLSVAASDTEAAWTVIASLGLAVGTLAMMVVAVALMVAADPWLALAGSIAFPLVLVANVVFQRVQGPLVTRAQALRAEVSEIAHESFDGAMVVKALGREAEETARFARKAHALRDTNVSVGLVRAVFDPLIDAVPNLAVLLVLAVGAVRVLHGDAAVADVVQVSYLLSLVTFSIRSIGWLIGDMPRSVVGYERVRAVLSATSDMVYGVARIGASDKGARLEMRGVSYGYGDHDVLEDVTFEVAPGRTVAVVGATAAGKSTLVSLVARLADPARGTVAIDGQDVRDLAPGALARHVALVPQQAFLFDDTVRDNVVLGLDVGDEEVWEALRIAQADGFVRDLAHGLDSRLGERGTSLSGGQRQRLSLARALVRRPRLLVMDDATSAVDPEVEARILAALRERSGESAGGSTVVLVAYRKATIALADEVVFLADGRIADTGTHAELVARNAAYRDLVNAYEEVSA